MRARKSLTILLTLIIACSVFPILPAEAYLSPTLALGSASQAGGTYYYPGAIVTGSSIRTLLINFTDSVTAGDRIILPSVTPAGFTVSASSAANDYAKRVNFTSGTLTVDIQAYIRSIGVQLASSLQTVQFTVTTDTITNDTFYRSTNAHYYQYIPYSTGTTGAWTDAYDAAKLMTYMGQSGYLATITSQSEDEYVNALSSGKTGWLGGTSMAHALTGGTMYYDGFTPAASNPSGWYWACGPEKGNVFYNVLTLDTVSGSSNQAKANTADAANVATYFNWSRPTLNIYSTQFEPNNTNEGCLTTLNVKDGATVIFGKSGTVFSWNNVEYNRGYSASDQYTVRGYFVEYGDLLLGDSGSGDTSFASAAGRLPITITADMPQTGDSSNLPLFFLLSMASGIGIAALAVLKKRSAARR